MGGGGRKKMIFRSPAFHGGVSNVLDPSCIVPLVIIIRTAKIPFFFFSPFRVRASNPIKAKRGFRFNNIVSRSKTTRRRFVLLLLLCYYYCISVEKITLKMYAHPYKHYKYNTNAVLKSILK